MGDRPQDPILDFFDLSKPFSRLRCATTESGHEAVPASQISAFWSSEDKKKEPVEEGTSYSFRYRRRQEEEIRRWSHGVSRGKKDKGDSRMMDLESVSQIAFDEEQDEEEEALGPGDKVISPEALEAYQNARPRKGPITFLPIDWEKDKILHHVDANQVTVITGVTGCGKTTRVPQFLFDAHFSENRYCNIIITQPRRIAAQSIAKRICDERGLQLGGLVGYKVGLDRENVSSNTRMLFCTTGILLKILVSQKNTQEFTHIILDEVHERDIDMDFVLLLVKKFIFTNSRGTKLILMSATSDPIPLQKYFSMRLNGADAGHIQVGGSETPFKIHEYFSCNKELVRTFKCKGIGPDMNNPEARLYHECVLLCRKIIENFDQLERCSLEGPPGAVLVFLPGEHEIQIVRGHLLEHRAKIPGGGSQWKILPLHSRIPSEEKDLIFKNYNKGNNNNTRETRNVRKIILSTNMAESSITIPDIVYVIDFCLTKNLRAERATNYVALRMEWADKNSLEQRKGRSGRVAEGRVYRLISKDFYDRFLIQSHDPEILRAPLDKVILGTKLLDEGPPKEILGLALSPPDLSNVYKSVMHLKEIGALLTTVKGKEQREDGDLTTLGEVIAVLPVDVRLGKMIVLGHLFNVLNEAVIIAAGMSHNSIFVSSFNNKVKSYEFKLMWSDGTFSDGIALKLAYEKWQSLLETGRFKGFGASRSSFDNELNWCRSNFLELKALREMQATIRDIQASLLHNGIQVFPRPNLSSRKTEHQKYMLIRIVMFGAFYPNYFIQSQNSLDSKEVNKVLHGKDFRNTLYFTGFPTEQTPYAPLYFGQIRNIFNSFIPPDENLRIQVQGSKVLVSFQRRNYESLIDKQCSYRLNGTVLQQVIVGLKLRRVLDRGESLKLFVYPLDRAKIEYGKLSEKMGRHRLEDDGIIIGGNSLGHFEVPVFRGNESTTVNVVHVNDPNSFYVHFIKSKNYFSFLSELRDSIKTLTLLRSEASAKTELLLGRLYLAQYTDEVGESSYYRCRLEKFHQNATRVEVFFLDYGNTSMIEVSDLIKVTLADAQKCPSIIQVPLLAVEASLSFVKPNPIRNKHMVWSSSSINGFMSKLKELPEDVRVQVYSVTEKSSESGEPLVSLEIISERDQGSISDWLKCNPPNQTPYGDHANESYLSVESHRIRNRLSQSYRENHRSIFEYVSENLCQKEFDELLSCDRREIKHLRGPFHPLESSLRCLHDLGSSKLVSISPDSVNSILLKQFPQEELDLWLVAGLVNLTPMGDKLSLRSTNFMPPIPGFGSIMSMIFGPRVELRCDAERTRLTGALVGLGDRAMEWGEEGKEGGRVRVPYHSDHDMEVEFDTLIDMEDIEYINKIRFSINYVLSRQVTNDGSLSLEDMRTQMKPRFSNPGFLGECHDNIDSYLNSLLSKQRRPVEKYACPDAFQWNLLSEEFFIKNDLPSLNGYLKLLHGVNLKCKSQEDLLASELRRVATFIEKKRISSYASDVKCPLCPGVETFTEFSGLFEHWQGLTHIYRENKFWASFRSSSVPGDLKLFEDTVNEILEFHEDVFCPLCSNKPIFYDLESAIAHMGSQEHLSAKEAYVMSGAE